MIFSYGIQVNYNTKKNENEFYLNIVEIQYHMLIFHYNFFLNYYYARLLDIFHTKHCECIHR